MSQREESGQGKKPEEKSPTEKPSAGLSANERRFLVAGHCRATSHGNSKSSLKMEQAARMVNPERRLNGTGKRSYMALSARISSRAMRRREGEGRG